MLSGVSLAESRMAQSRSEMVVFSAEHLCRFESLGLDLGYITSLGRAVSHVSSPTCFPFHFSLPDGCQMAKRFYMHL